jgi:uncharacterized protein
MFEAVWDYFETRDWSVHREHVDGIEQTLRAHGVTLAVGLSYPHKPGVAGPLNQFMEAVGRENGFFRPFASVHPEDEDFRSIVDHALDSPHLYGFKFQPLVQAFDVNDRRLDYLYEQCRERQFPITMHIGTAPIANDFVGPSHFERLIVRYPELRVCVAHMGAPEYDRFLVLLDDHPNMFLDTTMINVKTELFNTRWSGNYELLQKHAARVCFGSDWPNVPYPYQEALDSVPRFGFSTSDLPGVLHDNAIRFLNANPEPGDMP